MQLILLEAEERRKSNTASLSVKDEAQTLHEWFLVNHKGKQAPSAKTVENKIRGDHSRYKRETPEIKTRN
jgi:hypothetical protein